MKKITLYLMVNDEDADDFEDRISEHLRESMELYGSPFSIKNENGIEEFCQALVLYQEVEE